MEKIESDSRPQTYYKLTRQGRKAFEAYLKVLERILDLNK